jgi:hypothetical protein
VADGREKQRRSIFGVRRFMSNLLRLRCQLAATRQFSSRTFSATPLTLRVHGEKATRCKPGSGWRCGCSAPRMRSPAPRVALEETEAITLPTEFWLGDV